MKTEVSAGGVVVRKYRGDWEVLVVRDMNEVWTFPKGKVEKDEDWEQAARREIQEEVGIEHLTMLKKLPIIRYMYARNGLISKSVHYFLFRSAGREKLTGQKKEGIHDVTWMPIHQALCAIGYAKTNSRLLQMTQKILHTP